MPRLRQMQKVLLLEHFEPLELEYNSKRPEASESQFNYPYQSIVIRYSEDCLQLWKDKRYQKVLGTLFHEMTHQLTDALYAKACNTWRSKEELEDEREKLTDHIASMLLKLNLIK